MLRCNGRGANVNAASAKNNSDGGGKMTIIKNDDGC